MNVPTAIHNAHQGVRLAELFELPWGWQLCGQATGAKGGAKGQKARVITPETAYEGNPALSLAVFQQE